MKINLSQPTLDIRYETYTVYYKGKLLIGNKFKFIDIKSYLN